MWMVDKFEIDKLLGRKSHVIRDAHIFKISHMPNEIVIRQEVVQLTQEISKFINYKIPANVLVLGGPGTGKTVSAKYLKNKIDDMNIGIKTAYVNCRDKTSIEIISELLEENLKAASLKGFSIHEAMNRFFKKMDGNVMLVLDEIDQAKRIDNLLYHLSRPGEVQPNQTHSVSLVLISNNMDWENSIDSSTRSSLQLRRIIFKSYRQKDLERILTARAKVGFISEKCISRETIKYIASLVVRERNGDSRIAMHILFDAAEQAERHGDSKISILHVDEVYKKVIEKIERERIARLSTEQILILAAVFFSKENKDSTTNIVYERYHDLCKEANLKDPGRTKFYNEVTYLSNQGILKRQLSSDKRGIELSLKINPKLLDGELERHLIKQKI